MLSPGDRAVNKSGWSFQSHPCLPFTCGKCLGLGFETPRAVGGVGYHQGMFSWLLTTAGCLILPGLQVILYINEEEYNPFLVSSTGAKVIVHRQDEYPFIEDVGTEIETAMATSIGMHLVREYSDSRRLGEEDRFC